MALKILATSDLHLGMKFAGYPEAQSELTEARFGCLERLVAVANERRCDLLVVAGDLFHRVKVAEEDALRAAEILRGFEGRLVAVLPGNHDHLSPGQDPLWPSFQQAAGDQLLLLAESRPYPLAHYDLDACLYPGPCRSLHSAGNSVGWVRDASRDRGTRHHLGVAHGSLAGVSPDLDQSYYPMSEAELLAAGLQLWILGHTHLRWPQRPIRGDRIFLPGTPEPDGFDCSHAGGAWLLDLGDGGEPSAEALQTGAHLFVHERLEIRGHRELDDLLARHDSSSARRELVKVVLSGRLAHADRPALAECERRLRERVLWLDWQDGAVREEITPRLIDETWPEGSFPHRLLTELLEDARALEVAQELLEEARR